MSTVGSRNRFPLPEVAEALDPFIKSRQEVETIRDGLQQTFALTPVDLPQPLTASEKLTEPAPLSGVRKAYWKALQAHQEAQARYDALKAELTQASPAPETAEPGNAGIFVNHYIPLLRQREKQRRLEIVQRAYTRINAAGGATIGESFDSTALLGLGELPTPPTTTLAADRDLGLDVDEHLVKLKKAVLSAQQQLDEHRRITAKAADLAPLARNPHAELRALQSAHSELTLWMEEQLSMISDITSPAPEANGNPSAVPPITPADPTPSFSTSDIEALYDLYLDSRNRLLDTIEFPPPTNLHAVSMAFSDTPSSSVGSDPNDPSAPSSSSSSSSLTPSEAILPYLSTLISSQQDEKSLLQELAYLRRQISQSDDVSRRLVARLADESHLLAQYPASQGGSARPGERGGVLRGRDWAVAGEKAGKAGRQFVEGRIEDGRAFVGAAKGTLEGVKGLPDLVGG